MYQFSLYVQGSGKNPYEIKVYDNPEKGVNIRCSCPAGSRGNTFCKHVGAILVGDITKVVEGVEHIAMLHRITEGTHWKEKAANHKPFKSRKREWDDLTIEEIHEKYKDRIEKKGYKVEFKIHDDLEQTKSIEIYDFFKNGKIKRTPKFMIEYIKFNTNYTLDMEMNECVEIEPRKKKWLYKKISYEHPSNPLEKFLHSIFGDEEI